MLNKKVPVRQYLKLLEKRMHFLEDRVAASNKDLSWDRAEASALKWAIGALGGKPERNSNGESNLNRDLGDQK